MEFDIEKCAMFKMKSGKRVTNQESIRTLEEKENYKYLRIFEIDTIKQVMMKEKQRKD